MRWQAEIEISDERRRLVSDLLGRLGASVVVDAEHTWITASAFESMQDARAVRSSAEEIVAAIRTVVPDGVTFGTRVFDAATQRTLHTSDVQAGAIAIAGTQIDTIAENPRLSTLDREAAAAAAREAAYQRELAGVAAHALAVYRSDAARRVHRLRSGRLDTTAMNAIGEIIQDSVRGDLTVVGSSRREFGRFTGSMDHPATFGDEARHAVLNREPHPDPMTVDDARAYIQDLSRRWFDHLAAASDTLFAELRAHRER